MIRREDVPAAPVTMIPTPRTLLFLLLATAPAAQAVVAPPGWYSGDTHDHIQLCCGVPQRCVEQYGKVVLDLDDIDGLMTEEDLDVSSVLIWEPGVLNVNEGYSKYVCNVTGLPESVAANNTPLDNVIQYGVEISGLGAARWGHMSALNVTGAQARVATSSNGPILCSTVSPLNLPCPGPDGTGNYLGPVFDRFATCGAVRGYSHQAWPATLYDPEGLPGALLNPQNYTCQDLTQSIAFPDVQCLLGCEMKTQVLPAFAAIHVALGKVEFLESDHLSSNFGYRLGQECNKTQCSTTEAPWYGAYYRLLNAGLRVGIGAGSDRSCGPATGNLGSPRTYAFVPEGLTYHGWVRAVADGETTLSMGKDVFLAMSVGGASIGAEVRLPAGQNQVNVMAALRTEVAMTDTIEIVQNGDVVASMPFTTTGPDTVTFFLPGTAFSKSSWVAARLGSQNAHTAATYVLLDDEPIVECESAEYWIAWCDLLSASVSSAPGNMFGCLEADQAVLADIAEARQVFVAQRDLANGAERLRGARRSGSSLPGRRGPLSIGISERSGPTAPIELTCTNAPAFGRGLLVVSAIPEGQRNRTRSTGRRGRLFAKGAVPLHVQPVYAGENGFATATVPGLPRIPGSSGSPGMTLGARFLWLPQQPCGLLEDAGVTASDTLIFAAGH